MDKNTYSFDKKYSVVDDTGIELFTLTNFQTRVDKSEATYFTGKYFGITFGTQFGHLLLHFIGPYLYLKDRMPELELVFLRFKDSEEYLTEHSASENFAKLLNAKIINVNDGNYSFESFMFFYLDDFHLTVKPLTNDSNFKTSFPVIPSSLFLDKFYFVDGKSKELENFETEGFKSLYKFFKDYLVDNNLKNKVYIKRSRDNKRKGKLYQTAWYKNIRHIDDIYYDYMESMLIKKGYIVVDLQNTDFIEQINIFYNAKTIAVVEGAGILNALWCNNDTKIFKIGINKIYRQLEYPFDRMINTCITKDIKLIDVTDLLPIDGVRTIVNEL